MMQQLTKILLKKLEEAGSKYEGETNEKGEKHGKGKFTFIDGSQYDGSWENNQKHGYGVFTKKDGTFYKGYFQRDMKHGEGELSLPCGEIIKTTWKEDFKNGRGIIISKDKKRQ